MPRWQTLWWTPAQTPPCCRYPGSAALGSPQFSGESLPGWGPRFLATGGGRLRYPSRCTSWQQSQGPPLSSRSACQVKGLATQFYSAFSIFRGEGRGVVSFACQGRYPPANLYAYYMTFQCRFEIFAPKNWIVHSSRMKALMLNRPSQDFLLSK